MPNWIEGTIKLRGKSEDLKRFFAEGFEPTRKDDIICTEYTEEYCNVKINGECWIKGTRRAFVRDWNVYWEKASDTVHMPIKQAWRFIEDAEDIDKWQNISNQFHLDIRLYGFEQGQEFCEEVEIIDGIITMDKEIRYNDWVWECPMPGFGG